ncbi:MAG: hypothetical protein Q8P22_09625 [Chloroflexota bacterium]|nr:hypothetical protein [Chloroflexota bacterium]
MTQLTDTPVALLVCERCGQAAMGLWAHGDPCPNRRCGGLLTTQIQPEVTRGAAARPDGDGHDGPGDVLESTVPLLAPLPPSRDGEGETLDAGPEPEVEELVLPPPDHHFLAGRAYAVRLARRVVERRRRGETNEPDVLAEIRRRFVDLGAIYRPPSGVFNIQRAREQHRGQFFSNPAIGRLLFRLLQPPQGTRALESCVGIGNLIAEPGRVCVTGIDVDRDAVTVARALLGDGHCLVLDEFQHHRFDGKFELVLGNPPYSLHLRDRRRLWQHVGWDGWGRAEALWLEQAFLAVARPGVVAAVLPANALEALEPTVVRWVEGKGRLLVCIDLPPEAHASSDWPTALFIWVVGAEFSGPAYRDRMPSLDDGAIADLLARWPSSQLDLLAACRSAWQETVEQRRLTGDDGPVVVRPWTQPARQERRQQADGLPLVDQDVVLARIVDGRLRLVPNGWAAQAKLALLDEEMGTRYDRKREVYIKLWQELLERPPLLGLEDVAERLRCYGTEVAIDGQSERWLTRQRRWYERQMAPLSRWVAGQPQAKGGKQRSTDDVELDKAA